MGCSDLVAGSGGIRRVHEHSRASMNSWVFIFATPVIVVRGNVCVNFGPGGGARRLESAPSSEEGRMSLNGARG